MNYEEPPVLKFSNNPNIQTIFEACAGGDINAFKQAYERVKDINIVCDQGLTLLQVACASQKSEKFKMVGYIYENFKDTLKELLHQTASEAQEKSESIKKATKELQSILSDLSKKHNTNFDTIDSVYDKALCPAARQFITEHPDTLAALYLMTSIEFRGNDTLKILSLFDNKKILDLLSMKDLRIRDLLMRGDHTLCKRLLSNTAFIQSPQKSHTLQNISPLDTFTPHLDAQNFLEQIRSTVQKTWNENLTFGPLPMSESTAELKTFFEKIAEYGARNDLRLTMLDTNTMTMKIEFINNGVIVETIPSINIKELAKKANLSQLFLDNKSLEQSYDYVYKNNYIYGGDLENGISARDNQHLSRLRDKCYGREDLLSLHYSELMSVAAYSRTDYRIIIASLSSYPNTLNDPTTVLRNFLTVCMACSGLNKANKAVTPTVYRGDAVSEDKHTERSTTLTTHTPFFSTSEGRLVYANELNNNTFSLIHDAPGVNIVPISSWDEEEEYLIPPGTVIQWEGKIKDAKATYYMGRAINSPGLSLEAELSIKNLWTLHDTFNLVLAWFYEQQSTMHGKALTKSSAALNELTHRLKDTIESNKSSFSSEALEISLNQITEFKKQFNSSRSFTPLHASKSNDLTDKVAAEINNTVNASSFKKP